MGGGTKELRHWGGDHRNARPFGDEMLSECYLRNRRQGGGTSWDDRRRGNLGIPVCAVVQQEEGIAWVVDPTDVLEQGWERVVSVGHFGLRDQRRRGRRGTHIRQEGGTRWGRNKGRRHIGPNLVQNYGRSQSIGRKRSTAFFLPSHTPASEGAQGGLGFGRRGRIGLYDQRTAVRARRRIPLDGGIARGVPEARVTQSVLRRFTV